MKKRGRGIACTYFGMGNTAKPNPSTAYVEIEGGSAIVRCDVADIGQGSSTALAQIAAEVLGISLERVTLVCGDTMAAPEAGISSASRQTYVSGNAIRLAAEQAKKVLLQEAALGLEVDPRDLEAREDRIFVVGSPERYISTEEVCSRLWSRGNLISGTGSYDPPTTEGLDPESGQGTAFGAYSYCTQIAEVEVDTETGEVTVLSVYAAHDVGKAINPMAVEGQIEGGVSQGIGYALMEEIIVEDGSIQNRSFSDFLVPTSMDIPSITSIIVEEPEPTGPFGAKGTGEPPCCPTAAAIINAVYDAIGVNITSLPVTAEKVYMALKQKQEKKEE